MEKNSGYYHIQDVAWLLLLAFDEGHSGNT